jgi:hypothetical protein
LLCVQSHQSLDLTWVVLGSFLVRQTVLGPREIAGLCYSLVSFFEGLRKLGYEVRYIITSAMTNARREFTEKDYTSKSNPFDVEPYYAPLTALER